MSEKETAVTPAAPGGFVITQETLQQIIATAIAAAKAPNAVEQRQLDEEAKRVEQAQNSRKHLAGEVLADMERKRNAQLICSHEHANGMAHTVYIQEKAGPGYFICQKNQCKIRPEIAEAERTDKAAIYNTHEFNRLFQKQTASNEIFG
jgi:hypothetical protein